jgi:hypothetical protein
MGRRKTFGQFTKKPHPENHFSERNIAEPSPKEREEEHFSVIYEK